MGSNQYWAGRIYDLCVYYMTGTPEGSTESGFMEKPGIEPATPGLQDIEYPLHLDDYLLVKDLGPNYYGNHLAKDECTRFIFAYVNC